MSETITAYKAFNADLTCRGFQYEIGATYTHKGKVAACSGGFHACENPLDVWGYYPIVDGKGALTRYAEVELSGAMDKDGDKIAAAQITIKAEIRMPDFIKRAVAWVIDATKVMGDDPSGDYTQIGSSGYSAKIGSSGNYAQINVSGSGSVVASAGYDTVVTAVAGTWLSLAEYDDEGHCIGFGTGKVEKDGVYRAEGGKLVEVVQ